MADFGEQGKRSYAAVAAADNKQPSPSPTKDRAEQDLERQPLLSEEDRAVSSSSHNTLVEQENEEVNGIAVETKRRSWSYVWYTILSLAGLTVLVLFIKAFIDADDTKFDWSGTFKKALGGGLSGAAAMVLQVLSLMPLRTVMNYQYRHGSTTTEAVKFLYSDGGFTRFYAGLLAALIQGPVSRFGDTAANQGMRAFLNSNSFTKALYDPVKSAFASLTAALFRMVLTPIDTIKTTMQTEGRRGIGLLRTRIKANGIGTMWYGAWATAAATFVGHYPWFGTYNFLQTHIPLVVREENIALYLLREALIGFCASVVSDTISNSLRVVKTYRQVNQSRISYTDAARNVIAQEGFRGLFGRGLKTRILANGLQGLMFSILWKLFMDLYVPSAYQSRPPISKTGKKDL